MVRRVDARAAALLLLLGAASSSACGSDEGGVPASPDDGAHGGSAPQGGGTPLGGAGGSGGSAQGGTGGTPWQPVESDWCTGDWVGLSEDVCFYAPATATSSLLVFLHGMMPADGLPTTMQAMARTAADEHGFVALFPRGRQGLCSWDPSVEHWWCWPTSRDAVDTHAAALTAGWDAAAAALETLLGAPFAQRYLLGFSNGGYFASYVGLEDLWTTEGVGVVAAGRAYVDESLLAAWRPPFYIAVGALDVDSVQQSAENLAWVLTLESWPHLYVLHPGRGHELGQDDFDDAWALWSEP